MEFDRVPCNVHELKILPEWFNDICDHGKNFEIRKADRNYCVGDYLILKEWENGEYSGNYLVRRIAYRYDGDGNYGLSKGYCVLGIVPSHLVVIETDDGKKYVSMGERK